MPQKVKDRQKDSRVRTKAHGRAYVAGQEKGRDGRRRVAISEVDPEAREAKDYCPPCLKDHEVKHLF